MTSQFPEDHYWPQLEGHDYFNHQSFRTHSEEMKMKDELISEKTQCLRKAAEVHR
jgi:hypothetical protein